MRERERIIISSGLAICLMVPSENFCGFFLGGGGNWKLGSPPWEEGGEREKGKGKGEERGVAQWDRELGEVAVGLFDANDDRKKIWAIIGYSLLII